MHTIDSSKALRRNAIYEHFAFHFSSGNCLSTSTEDYNIGWKFFVAKIKFPVCFSVLIY